jgi:hypothetical protein
MISDGLLEMAMPVETLRGLDVRPRLVLDAITAVIAHSQIVVAEPVRALPAGFDDLDIAILEWIAAEGRSAGRSFAWS